jgi:hypothetical protein
MTITLQAATADLELAWARGARAGLRARDRITRKSTFSFCFNVCVTSIVVDADPPP